MINIKEHFKLTAVYTFFTTFPALLQLLVYPVIEGENRLGAEEFGYLAIIEVLISLVFTVCLLGTANGLARLYYDHKDDKQAYNKLVSTVLSGILGRGILLIGMAFILSPVLGKVFPLPALQNFGEYGPYAFISGLNRAVIFIAVVLFRHEKKLRPFIWVSLLSGIFRSVFQIIGVLWYDMSFRGYVYGTAIGGSIVALGIIYYLYKNCGLYYSKDLNNSLYPLASPLFFSELIFWGLLFSDRFFLLGNPEELGIYDNAMKFAIGIQLVLQGLSSSIQPEIFRLLKTGIDTQQENIKKYSSLFMAESLLVIGLTIIPVMIFIEIFYETQLRLSVGIIAIIFIRFIFRTQYLIFSWPVMFTKKTIYFFIMNFLVLIVNLVLNWLFTPKICFYGAIIAFIGASLIQVLAFLMVQQKVMPINWNYRKMLVFPFGIIGFAILLEIIKLSINLNVYISSLILVLSIISGLLVLYKNELYTLVKRPGNTNQK